MTKTFHVLVGLNTDNQERAAFKSLAEELARLSHTLPLADNEDRREQDECLLLASLFRAIPYLCPHNIAGLARLVALLYDSYFSHETGAANHHHAAN
jgi:hypothetical protein